MEVVWSQVSTRPNFVSSLRIIQLGPTYNSSVLIRDVALKTYWKRWTIERCGGRGSVQSLLMAQHHDDLYLIEYYIHFLSSYFFVNPFELPYQSYDILGELVDKPSIISYFPITFCPTLGHHQRRIYYKSVTFICTLLLYKN